MILVSKKGFARYSRFHSMFMSLNAINSTQTHTYLVQSNNEEINSNGHKAFQFYLTFPMCSLFRVITNVTKSSQKINYRSTGINHLVK